MFSLHECRLRGVVRARVSAGCGLDGPLLLLLAMSAPGEGVRYTRDATVGDVLGVLLSLAR